MPRPPRLLLSQSYYHIMTRGNNRNIVFKADDDYRYYLDLINKYKTELPFDLFHYCLMPNHTHMLIRTKRAHHFSLFMKKINLSYYHYYRKQYGWVGHFWQGRFKSQPIGKDGYFIQCGKYIELNPIRARLVDNPKLYQYSSYRHYAYVKKDDLITTDFIYEDLGSNGKIRRKLYRDLIIDEEITKSYLHHTWGSRYQRYQEEKKIRYHLQ